MGIEYMPEHPASEGSLCSKGNAALEILYHPDRIRTPLKRHGDGWAKITWEEALDLVAKGLGGPLKKYGPNSIGFFASSKCTNEENYLIEKLARVLGSKNVDGCARLCHAPSVVGLTRTLGAPAGQASSDRIWQKIILFSPAGFIGPRIPVR